MLLHFKRFICNIIENFVNTPYNKRKNTCLNIKKILIFDDEPENASVLSGFIRELGHIVQTAANLFDAEKLIESFAPDLLIAEGADGVRLAKSLHANNASVPVIIFSGNPAVRAAAADLNSEYTFFLSKPIHLEKLTEIIIKTGSSSDSPLFIKDHHSELSRIRKEPIIRLAEVREAVPKENNAVVFSTYLQNVQGILHKLAVHHDIPVLIEGPTGTGKEILAAMLHEKAAHGLPFTAVNCAAIPRTFLKRSYSVTKEVPLPEPIRKVKPDLSKIPEGARCSLMRSGNYGLTFRLNYSVLFRNVNTAESAQGPLNRYCAELFLRQTVRWKNLSGRNFSVRIYTTGSAAARYPALRFASGRKQFSRLPRILQENFPYNFIAPWKLSNKMLFARLKSTHGRAISGS